MTKLKVLDLFSGIGGFSLGLERTGGFETVAFCEIEEFPRRVLAKHWPEVRCYHDVRKLTADALSRDGVAVDVICGGFPCQDVSIAGKGVGINGKRTGLWKEVIRLASELRPRFLILENVPKLRSRGLESLLAALAEIGFDAEWHCVPAAHVGAAHRRDRLWLFAYRQGHSLGPNPYLIGLYPEEVHFDGSIEPRHEQERDARPLAGWGAEPNVERVVDGLPSQLDVARIKAVGNAVVPQIPELIGNAILASLEQQRAAA